MPEKLKKSKRDFKIQYQNHPHGQQRCGTCVMFRPPDTCTDVAGTILRNGWCKIWAAKSEAKAA
jgi:High potential iron-sulfur protein